MEHTIGAIVSISLLEAMEGATVLDVLLRHIDEAVWEWLLST